MEKLGTAEHPAAWWRMYAEHSAEHDNMPDPYVPAQWRLWARAAGGDVLNVDRARRRAVELMAEHGVSDWELRFGNAANLAGCVRSTVTRFTSEDGTRMVVFNAPGTITLSVALMSLWDDAQREQIIRHEIAHCLSGPRHDGLWRKACTITGARPQRLWGEDGEEYAPARWIGTCPGGHPHQRPGKPRKQYSCTRCHPGWDPRYVITWTRVET